MSELSIGVHTYMIYLIKKVEELARRKVLMWTGYVKVRRQQGRLQTTNLNVTLCISDASEALALLCLSSSYSTISFLSLHWNIAALNGALSACSDKVENPFNPHFLTAFGAQLHFL